MALTISTHARAEEADGVAPESKPATRHAVLGAAGASSTEVGGEIGYRLRLPSELQLGFVARASAVRKGFVDGFPARDGQMFSGLGLAIVPLARRGPLAMDLRGGLGLRASGFDTAGGPETSSRVMMTQLALIANVRATSFLTVRTGFVSVLDLALSPAGGIDALGQLLVLGAVVPVSDALQVYVDGETGGVFGYDGDGDKYVARAAIGLRWVSGREARAWTTF
jgi:hypothetical protein